METTKLFLTDNVTIAFEEICAEGNPLYNDTSHCYKNGDNILHHTKMANRRIRDQKTERMMHFKNLKKEKINSSLVFPQSRVEISLLYTLTPLTSLG